jgi:hypothetical protein
VFVLYFCFRCQGSLKAMLKGRCVMKILFISCSQRKTNHLSPVLNTGIIYFPCSNSCLSFCHWEYFELQMEHEVLA